MPRIGQKIVKQNPHLLQIGEHFADFQKNGQGYVALCPVHDDTNPSLSINAGKDGGVILHCFAGCPTEAVLEDVGLRMSDLMPDAKRIVATYDYHDEDGKLLYQTIRKESWDPTKKKKEFLQRQPKPGGGWNWSTKGVRRVLYRLSELKAAKPPRKVFVVEGEKDVDRLRKEGLVATTNAGGANAPWLDEYSEDLRGKDVVLISDNDPVGWERVEKIARSLRVSPKSYLCCKSVFERRIHVGWFDPFQ